MADTNSWTLEALRQHLEARIEGGDARLKEIVKRMDERDATRSVAIDHAERQANEWRGALNDLSTTRLSREEYSLAHTALSARMDSADKRISAMEGNRAGSSTTLLIVVGLLTLIPAIIALVLHLGK